MARWLDAAWMRGGTSKGLFFRRQDLPEAARVHGTARDQLLLRLMGSPDPYGTQIDGLGGATASTSKVVIVDRSQRDGCEVEYSFGAVSVDAPVVDWSGNCGNLTTAVAPFALASGLIPAGMAHGVRTVRMWQANIGQVIVAHVPICDGQVVEFGDFTLDGVAFPGAEIRLEFLDPGADPVDTASAMFPTGHRSERVPVPGFGDVEATLIVAGAPTVFANAASFGLSGTESAAALAGRTDAVRGLVALRELAAVRMGIAKDVDDAASLSKHAPRVAVVAPPADYRASDGKQIAASQVDLCVRMLSLGRLHASVTGTGAVALAVAAAVPGTVVAAQLSRRTDGHLVAGHPAGCLTVGADVFQHDDGRWIASRVALSRSARRLMVGRLPLPGQPPLAA